MTIEEIYSNKNTTEYQKLELVLQCEELKHAMSKISKIGRVSAIGVIIGYHYIFRDGYKLNAILEDLAYGNVGRLNDYHQHIKGYIRERYPELDEVGVLNYIQDNLINDGYVFHGFNGVFETSITNSELNATSRIWDVNEIQEVIRILNEVLTYSGRMMLGFNSHKSLYVTEDPSVVYMYATRSPEWFAQFIYNASLVNEVMSGDIYERRDYDLAYSAIINLCNDLAKPLEHKSRLGKRSRILTDEEGDKIIKFFERYWHLLVTHPDQLKLAIIKRRSILTDQNLLTKQLLILNNNIPINTVIKDYAIISLPSYNDVMSW